MTYRSSLLDGVFEPPTRCLKLRRRPLL